MRILLVCLGNICRSPMAEGIMGELIHRHSLDWEVDSAGTSSWHIGENPDPRSIDIAKVNGLDISGQISRMITEADFEDFDLILAMDREVLRDISLVAKEQGKEDKLQLFNDMDIPDPYFDDNGFPGVFRMIEEGCENLLKTKNA